MNKNFLIFALLIGGLIALMVLRFQGTPRYDRQIPEGALLDPYGQPHPEVVKQAGENPRSNQASS